MQGCGGEVAGAVGTKAVCMPPGEVSQETDCSLRRAHERALVSTGITGQLRHRQARAENGQQRSGRFNAQGQVPTVAPEARHRVSASDPLSQWRKSVLIISHAVIQNY